MQLERERERERVDEELFFFTLKCQHYFPPLVLSKYRPGHYGADIKVVVVNLEDDTNERKAFDAGRRCTHRCEGGNFSLPKIFEKYKSEMFSIANLFWFATRVSRPC